MYTQSEVANGVGAMHDITHWCCAQIWQEIRDCISEWAAQKTVPAHKVIDFPLGIIFVCSGSWMEMQMTLTVWEVEKNSIKTDTSMCLWGQEKSLVTFKNSSAGNKTWQPCKIYRLMLEAVIAECGAGECLRIYLKITIPTASSAIDNGSFGY